MFQNINNVRFWQHVEKNWWVGLNKIYHYILFGLTLVLFLPHKKTIVLEKIPVEPAAHMMFLWETLIIPTTGYLYLWIFFQNVCLYTTNVPGAFGGQRRVPDPLKLELYMVVCLHIGSENGTKVFWKNNWFYIYI